MNKMWACPGAWQAQIFYVWPFILSRQYCTVQQLYDMISEKPVIYLGRNESEVKKFSGVVGLC